MCTAVPPPAGPWLGSIAATVGPVPDGPLWPPQRAISSAAAMALKQRATTDRVRRVIKSGFSEERFDNDDVAPDTAALCMPFVDTDLAEPERPKQRAARRILRKHA